MKSNIQNDIEKIQESLFALHREAVSVAQNCQKRQGELLQEEKTAEAQEKRLQSGIASTERDFQSRIQENRQAQSDLREMCRLLPQDIAAQYSCTPQRVSTIDFTKIQQLFDCITTDTLASAYNRTFRRKGYYSQKEMVRDFLQMTADALLYLQEEEKRLLIQSKIAVASKQKEFVTGSRGLKAHLQSLRAENYQKDESEKRSAVAHRYAFFSSDLIAGFDARVKTMARDGGAFENDWNNYDPKRKRGYSFCFGKEVVPYQTESESLQNQLKQCLPAYVKGNAFLIPALVDFSDPLQFLFCYTEETKELAAKQIQLIILQLLRCAPINTYEIYFVDPKDRGANLGILNAPKNENEKIGIFVQNSDEEIERLFSKLEKEIDIVSAQLGAYPNVYSYNARETTKIKERVLVLFDFPFSLHNEDIVQLSIICKNAQRCGFYIILASPYSMGGSNSRSKDGLWGFLQSGWTIIDLDSEAAKTGCFILQEQGGAGRRISVSPLARYHNAFIKLYRKKWEDGQKIDNKYSGIFTKGPVAYKDATDGLSLPVMLDERGKIVNLPIGKGLLNHTLITGSTSSGKSSFLHMIIMSIVTNYHPDDVELWLVDYGKVEFNKHFKQTPPHVRFLSLEKSAEFTFAFLEYLQKYFSQREKKFAEESVTNIREYREKHGKLSMPRVVVMIDEFHNMTQHVKGDLAHRDMLENALSEYRKFGLSFIFSNQTVSGLVGLTDAARLQIRNRIALSNSISEMKSTIEASGGNYNDELIMGMERTATGEMWMREWSNDGRDFSIKKYIGIYINDRERENVLSIEIAKKWQLKNDAEVIKIDSSERTVMPVALACNHCKRNCNDKSFPLYVGSPVTIDRFFCFNVEQRLNNNILLVGRNVEPKRDIIFNIILSLSIIGKFDIIIYADKSDELYEAMQSIGGFRSKTCSILICDKMEDICASISRLSNQVKRREMPSRRKMIFWFGFRDIFSEFLSYPKKAAKIDDDVRSISNYEFLKLKQDIELQKQASELGITIDELVDGMRIEQPQKEVTGSENLYDASKDAIGLFQQSSKYNIFNIISLSAASEIKRVREMDFDWFDHKILTSPAQDDFYDLGIRRGEAEIEEGLSAIYTNGLEVKKFRPYCCVRRRNES